MDEPFIYEEEEGEPEEASAPLPKVRLPMGAALTDSTQRAIRFNPENQTLIVGNLSKFMKSPVPFGLILSCAVTRRKSGLLSKRLEFQVSLQNQAKTILTGAESDNRTIHILSNSKADSLVAVIKPNFLGTEFKVIQTSTNCEVAFIRYRINVLGLKGPRKMEVFVPKLKQRTKVPLNFITEDETLAEKYQKGNPNICKFQSKEPEYDPTSGAYSLQFYGRAKLASIKNFILKSESSVEFQSIIFGKMDEDQFALDVKYPFSLIQGFAISITSAIRKLAVE